MSSTRTIALGAGLGMIVGWLLGNAGYGLVLGAAAGIVCAAVTRRANQPPDS